ncbi:MAG: DUF2155 domain-containing protein [Asticcacaulis sp.]
MSISKVSGWGIGAVFLVCAALPTVAQVQTSTSAANTPVYVDEDNGEPESYYIDGVQYKPYVPEKKKAAPAPVTPSAPPVATNAPSANEAETPAQLHPYQPSDDTTEVAQASVAPQASASSSSSESSESYAPKKRPRYAVAVIEALDKVTAESVRFEVPIGKPTRYKGLIYVVKACETTADDEMVSDVMAYMRVRTNPVSATATTSAIRSKEVFKGWSFASTPGLNPIQHPVYDAWVIACRQPLPGVAS